MPIRIVDAPEPLSEASFEPDRPPVLVDSDASRLLVQEMERYCRQEINGRSFLISGHRGSGKTTLVLNSFLIVWKARMDKPVHMRPLLVQLHGPSLFPDPQLLGTAKPGKPGAAAPPGRSGAAEQAPAGEERSGDGATGNGAAPAAAANGGGSAAPKQGGAGGKDAGAREGESETQVALKQITLGMHRALAREVARCYRERALDTTTPGEPRRRELLELTAQLEMELYECLGPARLREFWERGGFLERGVLFPAGTAAAEERPDQGMRELLAVAGVCEAYCRIAGTYTLEQTQVESAKQELLAALSTDARGKDLFGPVVSLLTGGLVGAGLLAAETGGLAAAVGGIAAALGAATVFKYSSSRSRDRSVSREYSFLFDFSVATLDRVLPMLIERVLGAGLAPVFMVDELDKVDRLSERILGMVHHLKKFVAEKAFFCFLTDRSYFEEMTLRGSEKAYPVEYTYFSHPLFVVFDHSDLHRFVRRLLERPREPEAAEPDPADAAAKVEALKQARPASEDLADYDLLPFVLLHRSQMHPLDLKRVLESMRSPEGTVALPRGAVRSRLVFHLDLVVQLAVELVLDGDELSGRMRRDPEFRRLAHDALYYPTRSWRRSSQRNRTLDLGDRALAAFTKHLEDRTGSEPGAPADDKSGSRSGGEGKKSPPPPQPLVSPDDAEFLFRQVRRLAEILSDPVDFVTTYGQHWQGYDPDPAENARIKATISDLHLAEIKPFVLERTGTNVYRWSYTFAGAPYRDGAEPAKPEPAPAADRHAEEWEGDANFITRFAAWMEEL